MDPTTGSGQVQKTQNQAQLGENVVVAQPISSVSIHKEQAPITVSTEQVMQPTEAPPQLHQEVAEVGVEDVSQNPVLTPQDKQAGMELAKESVPHPVSPSGMVQLPLTEAQAQNIVKMHKKVTDSIYWLATLVLMQVKRMHGKLTSN